jgi:coenzyme F420-0:L-glutamate ligase/coenzyme F420-1:gamma-L-glutamate ligase
VSASDSPRFREVLEGRRSVRRFRPDMVPAAVLERVLAAAVRAPSAHNRQPWRFCTVRELATKERLADAMGRRLRAERERDGDAPQAIASDVQRSRERIVGAPVVIAVCMTLADMDRYPDERRNQAEWVMATQSTAMAGAHLLLAAQAEGLGACWTCAPLFAPEEVREMLQLPADWAPQGLVLLGYRAEDGKVRERRALSSVVISR